MVIAHCLFQGSFVCIKHTPTHTHAHSIFTGPCVCKCLWMLWAPRSESCFGSPAPPRGFPGIWHIPSSFSDILEQLPYNRTQLLQTQQTAAFHLSSLVDFPIKAAVRTWSLPVLHQAPLPPQLVILSRFAGDLTLGLYRRLWGVRGETGIQVTRAS